MNIAFNNRALCPILEHSLGVSAVMRTHAPRPRQTQKEKPPEQLRGLLTVEGGQALLLLLFLIAPQEVAPVPVASLFSLPLPRPVSMTSRPATSWPPKV